MKRGLPSWWVCYRSYKGRLVQGSRPRLMEPPHSCQENAWRAGPTRGVTCDGMSIHQFHEALLRFSSASSMEDITDLCRLHCQQMGFSAFIYALRVPKHFSESRLVMIKGYPDPWLDHYFEREFFTDDPVVAYCSRHIVPIQWHELASRYTPVSQRIMDEATEFGLRAGISMPVHSPQGELGILSLALDRHLVAAREVTQQALPYVQLLAGYLHEAVRRVLGLVDQAVKQQLTARETECLRWAADGKTSWEIGRLLHVSEPTVNFHLNNSMGKLEVSNRQHAVAKAVLQGLIKPHPF
jgi:DNA-binding CsgD family transcriptional regulator